MTRRSHVNNYIYSSDSSSRFRNSKRRRRDGEDENDNTNSNNNDHDDSYPNDSDKQQPSYSDSNRRTTELVFMTTTSVNNQRSNDGLSDENRVIENMQQTTSTYNNKNKTSKKVDLRNRRDMEATKTKTTSTSNRKTISKSDGLASSSKAAVTVTATVTNKPTLGATVASTIISTLNSISKSSTLSNQQPSLNGNNESLAGNSSSDNNDSNNEIGDDYTLIRSNSTLYSNYRPEVGVRTGLILAGMLLFIIFYILWRNRCRCLRRGHGSSSSDDLDMEFWLKHVDKQKEAAQKRRNLYRNSGVGSLGSPSGVALLQLVPSLPETVSDPHESTAAWVQDHRKIWQQMSREAASKRAVTANAATPVNLFHTRFSSAFLHPSQPPATEPIVAASGGLIDHILLRSASSAAVIPTRQIPRENLPSSPPPLQSPTTPGGGGGGNSSGGVFFGGKFARIISPFKRFAHVRESVNFSISGGSRRRFSQRGRRRKSPSDRVLVGAGTAGSGPFEEIDPQTQLLINYARFDADQVHHTTFGKQISDIIRPLHQLHHHEPTNGSSSNIELKHVNTANNPNLTIMPQVMIIESSDTTFNIQEQRVDVEEKILSDDKSNTEEDEQQEQFMRHALLSILLLNRRRRHSWPRCRHDNLQFNSFNREVRGLLFQHGHGSKMAYEYQNQNRNRHLNSPNSRHSNSNQMNNNSTIGSYNHSSNNMMMKTSLKSDNNSRK